MTTRSRRRRLGPRGGSLKLLHGIINAAEPKEKVFCVEGMRPRQAGIQFERPAELMFRSDPIPVEGKRHVPERDVGFCKRIVEFDSLDRCGLSLWHDLQRSPIMRTQARIGIR